MRIASPTARTRCFAAVLAFALLFAQALGFVHRSVHGLAAADAPSSSATLAQAAAVDGERRAWTHLFAHEDGGAECRLFDAVGSDALQPCGLVLPAAVPTTAVLAVLAGESLARWTALFDARGPPPAL